MPTTPAQALALIAQNAEGFLRRYPCKSFGANRASCRMRYNISTRGASSRPGSRLGTLNFHATTAFNLRPGEPMGGDGEGFWAHMITLQSSADPVNLYTVPNDDTNLLVTGALTSCAFVVRENMDGTIACAHIRPSAGDGTGTETGEALQDRLDGDGYAAVYGKRRYDHRDDRGFMDREVTIIGVRGGGGWQIFAQKLEPTGQYRIRSVHRIYPPE